VHIGRAQGAPVKITASKRLTLKEILESGAPEKGLNIIGVVDCGSPLVQREIADLLEQGVLNLTSRGDLFSRSGSALIMGVEVESREGVHFIIYLPDLAALGTWHKVASGKVKNPDLSTQKLDLPAGELINWATAMGGMFVVAHAFTPYRGAYGSWVKRLTDGLGAKVSLVNALELGLSADSDMADLLKETGRFTFLSNSDAHSPENIGREYNLLRMAGPGFDELKMALAGEQGRRVVANYGMDPRLGKYHRSYCPECKVISQTREARFVCDRCGRDMIPGIWDRIREIADYEEPHHPVGRPPYYYRVPLRLIPGVGPKTYQRLRRRLGNEIYIMESADLTTIARISSPAIAGFIKSIRENDLAIVPGGGGIYGKLKKNMADGRR
jgi:uncharacterized protein (TIGR00375 family)